MNKSELVSKIAEGADISQASAGRALNSLIQSITEELSNAGEVTLVGFGTYKVNDRAARLGRNPQTGEAIQIAAAKVPAFKPGKALKDVVNG